MRSSGAPDTERMGAEVAVRLEPGDLVIVTGELGSGKTTFVRGACRALGVEEPVVSPTFTIGRRYEARDGLTISHLDLYRLAELGTEDEGLLEDYLTPDSIAFVEWPEVASRAMPAPTVRVGLEHAGGDARDVTFAWAGAAGEDPFTHD